ncbi:MAG: ATP-binding protein [Desulfobacterales bacterium]|nr:ATP-binding protein [Desulfobacterales bacterium]
MAVSREQQARKKQRIRQVILICLCLILGLTILETRVSQLGEIPFPVSGNVLVFVLININVLLLLLIIFLVLRSLVELIFQRRQRILGAKLRTKLVISFVSLSLIPTALLFFIALQFVSTSMDYWFNSTVEQSLQESLNVAKDIYQEARRRVNRQGQALAARLAARPYRPAQLKDLDSFFNNTLAAQGLEGLELFTDQRKPVVRVLGEQLDGIQLPEFPPELFRLALNGEHDQIAIQRIPAGELVRGVTPVLINGNNNTPFLLVTSFLIGNDQLERMNVISRGIEGYRQLMLLKNPIKTSLLVMLLIVTLLIIFSAVWFGFYVAQGLTGPIGKLAGALKRVAEGELDFVLEKEADDEMGLLVDSFNMMTRDLATGSRQLEAANRALRESNLELDNRRQYTETILQNVAAGVISLDESGRITTINRFAEELLGIDKKHYLNQDYRTVLDPAHLEILTGFLKELTESGKKSIQRPIRLTVRDEVFSLLVNFTKLTDENQNPQGMVLVFDNLTQLEKAQRMAAWREVARRIAHEVKNPLTPIQLSAQRLRKKYMERLGEDSEVFDLCTRTIINQVDELKRLVSEFSSFARMPAVEKTLNNLADMVREVLVLYGEAHAEIEFIFQATGEVPLFPFDRKQMKRVLINLLDNAVAVLPDGGRIEIRLSCDTAGKAVFIEVRDNGPGVRDQDKPRLFEPYFSTKKTGTGLGLAIASTVVADHDGYIRVRDNEPTGAVFTIELPLAPV